MGWTRCPPLPPSPYPLHIPPPPPYPLHPVSRLQHAALSQNAHRPLVWTASPVWRLGCVNMYIFIDRGVVLLLIDYCLFVTSSLSCDPPGCLGHISPTSIPFFFKNDSNSVWMLISQLSVCCYVGFTEVECVSNLHFDFPGMPISLQDKTERPEKTFPSQIFIPQVLKHNFKKKREWICSSKAASRERPAQSGTISTRWASESCKTKAEKANTGPAGTLWPHHFELRTNFPLFCIHPFVRSQW